MDEPDNMPDERIKDILDRLAQCLGLAQQGEVLPPKCSTSSFQGRLRDKGTSRYKICDMKSPCIDCPCDSPNQAKNPTSLQSESSPKRDKNTNRAAEIYGGFEKGKMSKRKIKNLFC